MIFKEDCYIQETCKKYRDSTCDDNFCIRLFKQDELLSRAMLTDNQKKRIKLILDNTRLDEDAYEQLQQIQKTIVEFVKKQQNLLIASANTGNGKSSWAIKLLHTYIEKIWPESDLKCVALFVSIPKYFVELKSNISTPSSYIQYVTENVLAADIVVFDDLGSKRGTEFELDNLFNIINSRIESGKSCVYTTNILPEELDSQLGSRLASRIVGMSDVIVFREQDKRGIKL